VVTRLDCSPASVLFPRAKIACSDHRQLQVTSALLQLQSGQVMKRGSAGPPQASQELRKPSLHNMLNSRYLRTLVGKTIQIRQAQDVFNGVVRSCDLSTQKVELYHQNDGDAWLETYEYDHRTGKLDGWLDFVVLETAPGEEGDSALDEMLSGEVDTMVMDDSDGNSEASYCSEEEEGVFSLDEEPPAPVPSASGQDLATGRPSNRNRTIEALAQFERNSGATRGRSMTVGSWPGNNGLARPASMSSMPTGGASGPLSAAAKWKKGMGLRRINTESRVLELNTGMIKSDEAKDLQTLDSQGVLISVEEEEEMETDRPADANEAQNSGGAAQTPAPPIRKKANRRSSLVAHDKGDSPTHKVQGNAQLAMALLLGALDSQ
jgi:hypothetical protein